MRDIAPSRRVRQVEVTGHSAASVHGDDFNTFTITTTTTTARTCRPLSRPTMRRALPTWRLVRTRAVMNWR